MGGWTSSNTLPGQTTGQGGELSLQKDCWRRRLTGRAKSAPRPAALANALQSGSRRSLEKISMHRVSMAGKSNGQITTLGPELTPRRNVLRRRRGKHASITLKKGNRIS